MRQSGCAFVPPMIPKPEPSPCPPARSDSPRRFDVRSVTGARYTLIEESVIDEATGALQRRYRTAYAGLPVIANDDGSFTIVDTRTRLVRSDSR